MARCIHVLCIYLCAQHHDVLDLLKLETFLNIAYTETSSLLALYGGVLMVLLRLMMMMY